MARADLLIALIRYGANGDRVGFERAAEALIAEEEANRHGIVASQMAAALRAGAVNGTAHVVPISNHQDTSSLFYEVVPARAIDQLVLPDNVSRATGEMIEEHHRRDLLRSYGLEPRHRVLLTGPPGSGKTSLAEAIATAIAAPLLTVRYEGLIGSYLGETASRLQALFESARIRPCVLFLDEFDSVAKERGDTHETGEIKRVVSSLLLQIDRLPSHVVVIAATNHAELLDRAVWRRMQLRLELPASTRAGRTQWLEAWSERSKVKLGLSARTIADELADMSYAELEEFATTVQRRIVLAEPDTDPAKLSKAALNQWKRRAKPE